MSCWKLTQSTREPTTTSLRAMIALAETVSTCPHTHLAAEPTVETGVLCWCHHPTAVCQLHKGSSIIIENTLIELVYIHTYWTNPNVDSHLNTELSWDSYRALPLNWLTNQASPLSTEIFWFSFFEHHSGLWAPLTHACYAHLANYSIVNLISGCSSYHWVQFGLPHKVDYTA